jgi:Tat protein translocase TatB subunit
MPAIGPMEIVVIAALALIVFGPERLPEIAKNIGKAIREVRRMASDVKDEFDFSFDEDEPPPTPEPEPRSEPEAEAEPRSEPEAEAEPHPAAPPLARIPEEPEEEPGSSENEPGDRS